MDELYVVARRVLLDALDALGPHRDAVILVGAHAVYMRVGEGDLAVAPHTTDGDLAIDPARHYNPVVLHVTIEKASSPGARRCRTNQWENGCESTAMPSERRACAPIQIWVPDTRAEGFAEECARQVARAAAADAADPQLMNFVDAALDDLAELGDWN